MYLLFFRYGDRIVAVKVLHRGSNSEERASLENRFAREVNMMSRVKHENLVKVSVTSIFILGSTFGVGLCELEVLCILR